MATDLSPEVMVRGFKKCCSLYLTKLMEGNTMDLKHDGNYENNDAETGNRNG
jgi:hypothetical protein